MNRILPRDLPCYTTSDEQDGIARGFHSAALAALLKEPVDPSVPDDPKLLENEKLWESGDKDGWLDAELTRLLERIKK